MGERCRRGEGEGTWARASHPHAQAVEDAGSGDEKRFMARSSKANSGGPRLGDRHVPHVFSFPVDNGHPLAGQIEVADRVQSQPVGFSSTKEPFRSEGAVS
jgi:hypothetical protein